MRPLEFFEQLRQLVHQQHERTIAPYDDARLILNRPAVQLLCAAISDSAQLPAVVLLGQPGHVGYVEGCKVYYDPALDRDAEPVARFVVQTSENDEFSTDKHFY